MKWLFVFLMVLCGTAFSADKAASDKKKTVADDGDWTKIPVHLSSKGNDIAFDVTSIQVPYGKDIQLVFTNEAKPDSEILHNIAVLSPGSTDEVLKSFEESDYDVEKIGKHPKVIGITPTLNPGQKAELNLKKDKLKQEGYYPYICLIPGHADMLGMKGLMHVKKTK